MRAIADNARNTHVRTEREQGDWLLAVTVGQATPDGRHQTGDERSNADEDARPERSGGIVRNPQLTDVEGRNGSTNAKPMKTTKTVATMTRWLRRQPGSAVSLT